LSDSPTPTPTSTISPIPSSNNPCPDCLYFALAVYANSECCCTIKLNGEVILTPWANVYEKNEHVMLEAIADECCEFVDWTLNGGVINDSTIILNMIDNFTTFVTCSTITCEPTPTPELTPTPTPEPTPSLTPTPEPTAEPASYTLTITANGNGYTSPMIGTYVYDTVTVVEIAATPNIGWAFIGWSGNVTDTIADSITVVVDSNKVVTANFFAASPPTPEATPAPTPTITPSPVPTPKPTPTQPPVMVSLRVAGGSGSIGVGDNQQFTALAKYSDGRTIDVTGNVAWRSSNTEVVTIDSSGLARGVGGGKTEITASKYGITSKFTLTVVPAPALTPTPKPTPTPTPTPTSTPAPITEVVALPWSLIGGLCAFVLAAGLSSFFLIRRRRGKGVKEGSNFVMIRSPSASDSGAGGEMWYILSEGYVIKVLTRQDYGTESELLK